MRLVRVAAHRLRSLLRSSRAEAEMRQELAVHLEQLTREHLAAGMSPSEARRAARLEFGSLEAIKEQCRDMRRVTVVQDVLKDVVYACRLFTKSPGFTLTAVLSLALGIGANTAIFSLVDAVLLRRLPVREPAQLVEVDRAGGGGTLSYPMYEAIRDRNEVFSGVLVTSSGRYVASLYLGQTSAGDVNYSPVSGDYFAVVGASPVLGRGLTEEDLPASNVAVISHRLWQRAFAGDPGVLGKTMRVGRRDYTVVGVAPPAFTGVLTGNPIDVWVPITWFDQRSLQNKVALMFRVIGRRKPGVPVEQVHANMALIGRQLSAEWGFERPLQVEIADASGGLTLLRRQFSRPLWVLMTVVALLLLIATVNVANLLLARAGARRREIAVRLSLGASRWRLVRQLLTESAVLGGAGGALGVLLAPIAAASLVRFLSSARGTIDLALPLDGRLLAFTLVTSLAVVGLFGLAPALAATRLDLNSMLKGSCVAAGGDRRARPGRLLVAGEVAVSCILLTGAILFARSLRTLTHLDPGFRPENVLLLGVGLDEGRPRSPVERVRTYDRVLERLAAVPGVHSTALSSERLFGTGTWTEPVIAPTFTPRPGQDRDAVLLVISPRFFETMGTRVLQGRRFEARDHEQAPRVAIVNEAAARYYFGAADATGQTFHLGDPSSAPQIRVIGVVQDAKYRSLKDPAPRMIYLPALQEPGPVGEASLAIRTAGDPEKMADVVWKEARSEVGDLRWRGVTTQTHLVDGTIAQDRMLAQLSAAFGLTAVVLVCLGLYGLTAYDVSRRTAEIGIRLALGAQRADVVRLMVGRSMILVAAGVGAGLAGAAALAQLVETLLFGVRSSDAVTLGASAALLLTVGAAAAYGPARRAAQLNPVATLRVE